MIRSFIITALRVFLRNRVPSVINIIGLAAGIAASIIIMLYVFNEFSADKFNENYDRIYRVEYGDFFVSGTAQALLLKEEFPEVEQAVRFDYRYDPLIGIGDRSLRFESFLYADSTLFDVFSFDFLRGDPSTALKLPFSLVLTETEATKIFGSEDPVGEILKFNNLHEYIITAVIKDVKNTHLPVSAIGSFGTLPVIEKDENHDRHLFSYMNFITYVSLHKDSDSHDLAIRFNNLLDERYPERSSFEVMLRPLSDIYFNRHLNDSPPTLHGNLPLLNTLIAVAGMIMLIAIFNFINLATANASVRAAEIGIRKVMGANKNNLVFQFLAESLIVSMIAFILAIVLVELLLPVFNNLLRTDLMFNPFISYRFFWALLVLIILTGFLAGLYPAFYLSSLKPNTIIKGERTRGRGALFFRRSLIVLQFTISIVLIAVTLIVERQVNYMRNKYPGFQKNNVVLVWLNSDVYSARDVFIENLMHHNGIVSVSLSNNLPGYVTWFNVWLVEGENKPHKFLPVDPDYIDLMGIEITKGRNFDWNRIADQEYTYILNEEAVRYFGFDDPVGKEFMIGGQTSVRIIGVVEDFHFRSLHEPIGPLVLGWQPRSLRLANIRISNDNPFNTVNLIRDQWESISPGSPFEYKFLEDELDRLYFSEIRLGELFRYFALLAMIIACMGLYGLSTFISLQKTQEIGIRKVLGAGINRIVFFMAWEFARWVILANIIAWPVAYLVMSRWLENFPYRTVPDISIFIIAGLMALLIAIITVSSQAWKMANINPANTLRNE